MWCIENACKRDLRWKPKSRETWKKGGKTKKTTEWTFLIVNILPLYRRVVVALYYSFFPFYSRFWFSPLSNVQSSAAIGWPPSDDINQRQPDAKGGRHIAKKNIHKYSCTPCRALGANLSLIFLLSTHTGYKSWFKRLERKCIQGEFSYFPFQWM